MKKSLQAAGSAFGASWIVFWAKSLDTALGCICFAIGIAIFAGSWISIFRTSKKDKKEN